MCCSTSRLAAFPDQNQPPDLTALPKCRRKAQALRLTCTQAQDWTAPASAAWVLEEFWHCSPLGMWPELGQVK